MSRRRVSVLIAAVGGIALVAVALVFATNERLRERIFHERHTNSLAEFSKEHGGIVKWHLNSRAQALAIIREKSDNGGEAGAENSNGPAQESYADRAYPATTIGFAQQQHAQFSWKGVDRLAHGSPNNWQELGPKTPIVAGPATYTGRETTISGRVTALAVSPGCRDRRQCRLFVGAAGGGVWMTDDALRHRVEWRPIGNGIPSNAIGSIYFDPTDSSGRTLYVGTGEPNGSSDSEAGVGLYKTTNGGHSWTLVPGSIAAAKDRSISGIVVDSANAQHIWIGTAVARHGSSSVNGGRFTPAGAPPVGLYESTDGGQTFSLAFSLPSDPVDPTTANGGDFFRGGVSKLEWDSLSSRVYFSVFDYGLYRQNGSGGFERIFITPCDGFVPCSLPARTEFSLAPLTNGKLRIYLGDWDGNVGAGVLWRTDDANVPASQLTDEGTGDNTGGWTLLSDSTPGTPGFSSFNFCGGQCSYDMPVFSPPGQSDIVYIGGQMQYDEIFTATPPSNGRTVQRSVDAGVHFTDMTNDTQSSPLGMHPDQHAMAFGPNGAAFFGSDGGVVRTTGQFADASGQCAGRGISGADLTDCQMWLSAIPTRIDSLNDGLATLQFQSVSVNPNEPLTDLIGGTQDNGTWVFGGRSHGRPKGTWFESVGGDGGQSGIDVGADSIRIHSYFGPFHDVNFNGNDPLGWDWVSDPFNEASSFYVPLLTDPVVSGTIFDGLQHVWRTTDNGGSRAYLDLHCNEFTGDFSAQCGDWVPIGEDLSGTAFGTDKGGTTPTGNYVVALARSGLDRSTLWAATRRGRVFVSTNADAAAGSVSFDRIDTSSQPTRFVSGIAIDPADKNHAWISYSGYDAYATVAGTATGHVFEVRYNPVTHSATWSGDLAGNLGDQPLTSIAYAGASGDLYVGTDFGVAVLKNGSSQWVPAAGNLPPVAVYGLTIVQGRTLYAATHGRGIWRLELRR